MCYSLVSTRFLIQKYCSPEAALISFITNSFPRRDPLLIEIGKTFYQNPGLAFSGNYQISLCLSRTAQVLPAIATATMGYISGYDIHV